jgi:hypothetical protein
MLKKTIVLLTCGFIVGILLGFTFLVFAQSVSREYIWNKVYDSSSTSIKVIEN